MIFFWWVASSDTTALRPTSLPGPRRGGDGDHGRGRAIDGARRGREGLVLEQLTGVMDHHRHALGHVERGPASEDTMQSAS